MLVFVTIVAVLALVALIAVTCLLIITIKGTKDSAAGVAILTNAVAVTVWETDSLDVTAKYEFIAGVKVTAQMMMSQFNAPAGARRRMNLFSNGLQDAMRQIRLAEGKE